MNSDTRINGLNLFYVMAVITAALIGICFIVGNPSTAAAPAPAPATTTDPATVTGTAPATEVVPPSDASTAADTGTVFYADCAAVIAAGAAPIYPTDPGWDPTFDDNDNGIGCE